MKRLKDAYNPPVKKEENILNGVKKFWRFLKKDSWPSLLVTLLLAFIIIKFVFFPTLSFFTGTNLPLVIVESCSMYHSEGWETIFGEECYGGVFGEECDRGIYSYYNLKISDALNWPFQNGLSKGDIIFAVSPRNIEIGDVIIFNGGASNPVIHRVIKIDSEGIVTTKGDHNQGFISTEKRIMPEQILGKAVLRVPFIGWAKLIFFEFSRDANQRGFCS